jgi:hypothetical protein
MGASAKYEIPAGLKEAQERFEQWRSSQTGRRPIPESLWVSASELARQHGVLRTAQVLRLDYSKLKQLHAEDSFGGDAHSSRATCIRGTDRIVDGTSV